MGVETISVQTAPS